MEYNYKEVEPCLPDPQYLKWNPIKATLYHFDPTQARIERRVARSLLWHSEKNLGEGVEVSKKLISVLGTKQVKLDLSIFQIEVAVVSTTDPKPCRIQRLS